MEKQKVILIAEKTKSFAIALIGIVFVSWGTNYLWGEHLLYNVPRILLPIFNLFGPVGLAIGLLLLGLALIVYGFIKWKKVAEKSFVYWVIVILALAAGVILANVNFRSSEEIQEKIDQQRENQIDEIRNSEKPDFKNKEVEKHFDGFDDLYKRYEKAIQSQDAKVIQQCEDDYVEWTTKTADFMPKLNNDEKYEVARYNAKLAIMWGDLRQSYLKNK
jgi:uncharacterized membrane-anchored protein YhcB (DUF1043 family)